MNEGPRQSHEAESSGPLGGERLAAARRAHEISATDIAKELHLDELKIRALEKNDFAVLGAPVFAKGHLRKYAELVGVPVDDVLADYYELNRSTGAPPVVGSVRKFKRDFAMGPWISVTVIIVIILGTAYWFFTRGPVLPLTQASPGNVASLVSTAPGKQRQVGAAEPVDDETGSDTLLDVEEASPDTVIASLVPPVSEAEPLVEETSLAPQVNVELVYSGECWTEVTDASGRSLFYDLGREGRVVTLAGDEPLQVVLGDSENVSIAVDGRDYPIPDSARRGRMARLTINRQ